LLHCFSAAAAARPTETGGFVGNRAPAFTMAHAWMSVWIPATRTLIVTANLDALEYLNMSKLLDRIAIALLLALVGVGFSIMYHTAESNAVTTDVALIQTKNKARVIQEIRLITLEIRNLQKDIDVIRDALTKKGNNDNNRK